MDSLRHWSSGDLGPVVILFTAAAAFCIFQYGTSAENYLRWFSRSDPSSDSAKIRSWIFQRLGGLVWLGIVPALVAVLGLGRTPQELGLRLPPLALTAAFVGGSLVLLVPSIFFAARKPTHWARYPELRLASWTPRSVWTNAWSWSLYLVGYELFFRGILLSELVRAFGVWPGIAVMTALYVYAHLTKDAPEAIGCIFMGVVFAWMTLETGAIWAAVVTHIGIALSSDTFAMRAHPQMRFSRS